MKKLTRDQIQWISGGSTPTQITEVLIEGLMAGGAAGLGIAASGLIIHYGIEKLVDLFKRPKVETALNVQPLEI